MQDFFYCRIIEGFCNLERNYGNRILHKKFNGTMMLPGINLQSVIFYLDGFPLIFKLRWVLHWIVYANCIKTTVKFIVMLLLLWFVYYWVSRSPLGRFTLPQDLYSLRNYLSFAWIVTCVDTCLKKRIWRNIYTSI